MRVCVCRTRGSSPWCSTPFALRVNSLIRFTHWRTHYIIHRAGMYCVYAISHSTLLCECSAHTHTHTASLCTTQQNNFPAGSCRPFDGKYIAWIKIREFTARIAAVAFHAPNDIKYSVVNFNLFFGASIVRVVELSTQIVCPQLLCVSVATIMRYRSLAHIAIGIFPYGREMQTIYQSIHRRKHGFCCCVCMCGGERIFMMLCGRYQYSVLVWLFLSKRAHLLFHKDRRAIPQKWKQ